MNSQSYLGVSIQSTYCKLCRQKDPSRESSLERGSRRCLKQTSIMRTAQEPDALRFGCFREYLHALALASLDIIFLALFKLDRLCVDWEVHMPIRRVEAFLYGNRSVWCVDKYMGIIAGCAHWKDN
jgi:hypothetical protein